MRFRTDSIREIREQLSLTQHALAAELGVPQSTVFRWEAGRTTPNADHLAKIHHVARSSGVVPKFFGAAEKTHRRRR